MLRNLSSFELWESVSGSEHPTELSAALNLACLQSYGRQEKVLVNRFGGLSQEVMSYIPLEYRDVVLQDLYQMLRLTPVESFHSALYRFYEAHFKICSQMLSDGKSKRITILVMAMAPAQIQKFEKADWHSLAKGMNEKDLPTRSKSCTKLLECFKHEMNKRDDTSQSPAAKEKKSKALKKGNGNSLSSSTPNTKRTSISKDSRTSSARNKKRKQNKHEDKSEWGS